MQLRWQGWLTGLLPPSGLPVSGDSIGDFLNYFYFIFCASWWVCAHWTDIRMPGYWSDTVKTRVVDFDMRGGMV